jgi:single-stranded DNA-binding protein
MTSEIYVNGRLSRNPEVSVTAKGKPFAKLLIETDVVRQVRKGEYQSEQHLIPVTVYSWLVDQIKNLRGGDYLTVCTHASGTAFVTPNGETKYGCQLVATGISFPPAYKPAAKELAP